MLAYADSSAVLAIVFGEPGGQRAAAAMAASEQVYSSPLLETEVRSATAREGVPPSALEPLLRALAWVNPERRLTREIDSVLAAGRLRGADLFHLASALYLSRQPSELAFLTLDDAQRNVAARLGFATPLGRTRGR